MAGKGKFIYVFDDRTRIKVADSAFKYDAENDLAFPISKFSTDDLLKLKAQVATELENRMDLDGVVEQNLEKLKAQIRGAKGEVVAQLIRQTLDRLDIVSADEKRAKTRLEILTDEMKYRMVTEGESEKKFAGLITATYKAETVYNVGEDGWGTVYSGIVADALDAQCQARLEALSRDLDLPVADVKYVADELIASVRDGLVNSEAFAIIQKRLTSTTLNDLVKQGYDLPKGIESQEVRKVKIKRSK